MRRILRARLLASVLTVGVFPFAAAVPAQAQERWDVSFDSFHHQLARYGDWVYSDRWGLVWQPADVSDDFRPYYSGGRWVYTGAYGWTWASDYDWGDIAFHYGRWVDDPYDGWMWIPGYSWSPGWVVWRSNRQSVGWMPMPPDDGFLGGRGEAFVGISFGGISASWNNTSDYYGYSRWYGRDYDQRRFAANWTFVDTGHMADRDYRHVAYTRDRAVTSIRQTTNITNYTVVNNYMVNRSVDVHAVERARGQAIVPVAAAAVFKRSNSVATVDDGQKYRVREFNRAPHGTGVANSAPPPPPAVIDKLSDHAPARHAGGTPGLADKPGAGAGRLTPHVFTKATIATPAATTQFHGQLRAGPAGATPGGTAVTPTSGPKGLPPKPASAAPVTTPTGSGTMMGPNAGHPVVGGHAPEAGSQIGGHAGKTQPVTGPAATASPATMPSPVKTTGPGKGPTPSTMDGGRASETGNMHDRRMPDHMTGATGAPTDITGKARAHAVGDGIAPPAHPVTQPVVRPAVEPVQKPLLEHKAPPPVTAPVSAPAAAPVVHPTEHKMERPVPVTHTRPAATESGSPPAGTDEAKKTKHETKGEQNPPN
ncbi:DUF6600 domain-containing protein [Rhizomicrobium electricum]|uniref:Uncharacterized protein n=1 Tax=Rhizomicrobium electricum TaxID=480070 RepID=A0ABN1E8F8_9PROT|nr:DUF6600 domain-containing protein [Rhizomicrobium electricum]NIJ47932.1 hypothetical protein [Rhizomicrobium electricum]